MNNNNNNKNIKPPYTRFHYAVTDMQKNSLAELKSGKNISEIDGFLYKDKQGKIKYHRIGSSLEMFTMAHTKTKNGHKKILQRGTPNG